VVEMESIGLCVVGCGWSNTDKHKQGKRKFEEQAMGRLDQAKPEGFVALNLTNSDSQNEKRLQIHTQHIHKCLLVGLVACMGVHF